MISPFRLEELTNRLASLQQENKVLKIELETYKLKCKALQEENRDLRKASVTIVSPGGGSGPPPALPYPTLPRLASPREAGHAAARRRCRELGAGWRGGASRTHPPGSVSPGWAWSGRSGALPEKGGLQRGAGGPSGLALGLLWPENGKEEKGPRGGGVSACSFPAPPLPPACQAERSASAERRSPLPLYSQASPAGSNRPWCRMGESGSGPGLLALWPLAAMPGGSLAFPVAHQDCASHVSRGTADPNTPLVFYF